MSDDPTLERSGVFEFSVGGGWVSVDSMICRNGDCEDTCRIGEMHVKKRSIKTVMRMPVTEHEGADI